MIGPHVALDQVVFAVIGPAVISHAAVDLNSGDLGFRARGGVRAGSSSTGVSAAS